MLSTPTTGISAPIRPANATAREPSQPANEAAPLPLRGQASCKAYCAQSGGTSGERLVEIPRRYYVASQVDLTHIDAGGYNLLRMLYLISASRNLALHPMFLAQALYPVYLLLRRGEIILLQALRHIVDE